MHSATLGQIVRYMGVESDNFTAEMLLKQLGAQTGGPGTSARGAAAVTAVLRTLGVPLGGVRLVDGSGLSLLNRLTRDVARLAAADRVDRPRGAVGIRACAPGGRSQRHDEAPPRSGPRPRAGEDGDDGHRVDARRLRDRALRFAILHNGRPVSTTWARLAQDRFVLVLAAP